MATVKIEGLPPWNGDYPLDISFFTNRELHVIKREAGVRGGEIQDALTAGDNDVMVALTLIATARAGVKIPPDDIWDAEVGKVVFDFEDEVAEADPPAVRQPDSPNSDDGLPETSGSASNGSGDNPASDPKLTGLPGSDITAISDLEISAT